MDLSEERISDLLRECALGHPYRFLETTSSTNDLLLDGLRSGLPHGAVIAADSQTRGRGRPGRAWEGGNGRNLLFSVGLRRPLDGDRWGLLGGAVAVAVAETLHRAIGRPFVTKWPNDVWHEGRKIAGILLEACRRGDRVEGIVAGIGLNVNQGEAELPASARVPATSLFRESGRIWDRGVLLAELLKTLDGRLEELSLRPDRLLEDWSRLEITLGRSLVLREADPPIRGRGVRLLPDGSLCLLIHGIERRWAWGEVSLDLDAAL